MDSARLRVPNLRSRMRLEGCYVGVRSFTRPPASFRNRATPRPPPLAPGAQPGTSSFFGSFLVLPCRGGMVRRAASAAVAWRAVVLIVALGVLLSGSSRVSAQGLADPVPAPVEVRIGVLLDLSIRSANGTVPNDAAKEVRDGFVREVSARPLHPILLGDSEDERIRNRERRVGDYLFYPVGRGPGKESWPRACAPGSGHGGD